MRALFIAAGVGVTVYWFASHHPLWMCITSVVLDVALVLQYLKEK